MKRITYSALEKLGLSEKALESYLDINPLWIWEENNKYYTQSAGALELKGVTLKELNDILESVSRDYAGDILEPWEIEQLEKILEV